MARKILNHNLIFITFGQLFYKAVYGQFIPGPRIGHTAVLAGDKVYFIGGFNPDVPSSSDPKSDCFYLGGPTKSWVDLKNQVDLPLKISHTACTGGVNEDSIFIIGNLLSSGNLVDQFDTKKNTTSTPSIQGKAPANRGFANSACYKGKIYVLGGQIDSALFGSFDILDTINLRWETSSSINIPSPRSKYTATLVDDVIYYIGGVQQNEFGITFVPMTDVSNAS
jgi:hypothetical protein